ncbi:MAG: 3-keto-5-aminohexanoate cleavage protein [Xanthobacteraceae bacterium]|nr:3-keto-5-aminohexanoate cleavage protein [Xanthobacteraceae bacterium]
MGAVFIEAALNGPWGRERQPAIPVSVAEIVADGIASAGAGAAILHLHAYDEATGRQRDDWETYARIIEGIRARVDAIVYPTIPIAGSGFAGELATPQERYRHLDELARRGLVEWAVVDPGSVNITRFEEIARGAPGFVYLNPDGHLREGLRICAAHAVRPSYAIYEPGATRLGAAAAAAMPGVPTPVYRFMFSDEFTFGFPPAPKHLAAHLALLADTAPDAPFMVAGLGVDIRPLIAPAVEHGGHIRVGLEDQPFGTARTGNRDLVEEAGRLVRAAGGEPATAAEVREACLARDEENRRAAPQTS